jgi:hypothetical protein
MVRADGKNLLEKPISPDPAAAGRVGVTVDLSGQAGKSTLLELVNQPNGWEFEAGYRAEIALESR